MNPSFQTPSNMIRMTEKKHPPFAKYSIENDWNPFFSIYCFEKTRNYWLAPERKILTSPESKWITIGITTDSDPPSHQLNKQDHNRPINLAKEDEHYSWRHQEAKQNSNTGDCCCSSWPAKILTKLWSDNVDSYNALSCEI
jgi:hypothetical protein